MISYPTSLPQPSQQLMGETSTPVVRTDIPLGLIRQESRYATARRQYTLSWVFNRDQLIEFEEWYQITLGGGVLTFGLVLHGEEAEPVATPVRFVGGDYRVNKETPSRWRVQGIVEQLTVEAAPTNRTPSVPVFARLGVDPTESQYLTLHHRNALLTVRPGEFDTTLLHIYPPTSEAAYIYFGVSNMGLGETRITSQDVDPLPVESTPSFPGTLPSPQLQIAERVSNTVARLDMESGHSRQYSMSDGATRQYDLSWEFDVDEYHTFREFYFDDIKSGSTPFLITLDVDGQFSMVLVRAVGGTYKERYVPAGQRFLVSLQVDRIVGQSVSVTNERPYPVHYGPTVHVWVNRKILAADEGKFFVCHPALGQTISLHIYDQEIEFGLLNVGLGDVLITRSPYILDIGTLEMQAGSGTFGKPEIELVTTLINIGTLEMQAGSGTFGKPEIELVTTLINIGTLEMQAGSGTFGKPTFELLTVLVDIGTLEMQAGSGTFGKPTFELAIP